MTTTGQRDTATPVRFGQRPARGIVAGLSAPRVAALGVCVLIMIVVMATRGVPAAALAAVAVSPLAGAAAITVEGRSMLEWAPIAARHLTKRRTQYLISPSRPHPAGSLGLPGDASHLRLLDTSDGTALIHDSRQASYTAVAAIRGDGFLLADPDTQDTATSGWGRTLAGLATDGQITRIQVLHTIRPDTGTAARHWWNDHGDPDAPPFAADTYRQLLDTADPGWRHDTLLAITLAGPKAQTAIRKAGRSQAGAAAVMTAHRAALATAITTAGARVASWLTGPDITAAVRIAADPASAPHLDQHPDTLSDPRCGGPAAVEETWTSVRCDSAIHTVLWISQWPRADTHPAFLAPLQLPAGATMRLSLTYEPIPTAQALRDIRRDKTANLSDRALKQRLGRIDTPSDNTRFADADQREADLIAGHIDMRHIALIAVTAPDRDALSHAVARVRQAAATSGCDTRILYGQQLSAFHAAALPLTRGM